MWTVIEVVAILPNMKHDLYHSVMVTFLLS